jgi:hypothetical protein
MTRLPVAPSAPVSVSIVMASLFGAALLVGAFATGCGASTSALSKDGGTGSAGSGSAGIGGTAGLTGAAGTEFKVPIGMTECSNGKDDDMDGLIDSADPECIGLADNKEATFATGIPGDNIDACKQDCFFDGNSGMGDDGCDWQLKCDPLSKNSQCPYDMSYATSHTMECSTSASQSQKCIDNCRKYVPNGCDCFGCCVVPGAATPIRLDPTCTSKDFGDPTKCSPCTQITQCLNKCDPCELCLGKTTVPAYCNEDSDGGVDGGSYDGGTPDGGYGVPKCTDGVSCVPGPNAVCPDGYGCVYGCCLNVIP